MATCRTARRRLAAGGYPLRLLAALDEEILQPREPMRAGEPLKLLDEIADIFRRLRLIGDRGPFGLLTDSVRALIFHAKPRVRTAFRGPCCKPTYSNHEC